MDARVVMASRFKEQCLMLIDEVARTRRPIVVTKRGRPVAQVVPIDEPEQRPTMGSVGLVAAEDEAYFTVGEPWEAAAT